MPWKFSTVPVGGMPNHSPRITLLSVYLVTTVSPSAICSSIVNLMMEKVSRISAIDRLKSSRVGPCPGTRPRSTKSGLRSSSITSRFPLACSSRKRRTSALFSSNDTELDPPCIELNFLPQDSLQQWYNLRRARASSEGTSTARSRPSPRGSHRDHHPAADTPIHGGFIGLCYHWLGSETRSVSERLLEREVRVNMPEVTYGGENGKTAELEVDPDLVAVRARRGGSLREGPVRGREAALLNEMDTVLSFPEVGVEVYRRRERASRSMEEMRRELHESPATRFAGRVLVDEHSREPAVYTENLFVKFYEGTNRDQCLAVLREAGLIVKRELPYATNAYFVAAPEGTGQRIFDIAIELLEREDVEYCHPELVRPLGPRTIFPQQWHLKATTVNDEWVNASANIEAAHTITEGEGVTIAVIDTGIDIDHEEFSGRDKLVAPRDTTANDTDPRPTRRAEKHGTACAGVACGDGRFGASGVAPRAKLMPIRMMSQLGSQAEADAFYWAAENGADIISCSWGPEDGYWKDSDDPLHDTKVPLPDSTRLAIDYAVDNGRGCLGCVLFFAACNRKESVDNDG